MTNREVNYKPIWSTQAFEMSYLRCSTPHWQTDPTVMKISHCISLNIRHRENCCQ